MAGHTSAYLVVTRFEVLYTRFANDPRFDGDLYAVPLRGTRPGFRSVRYRGLDRDPLTPWPPVLAGAVESPAPAAETFMAKLDDEGRCDIASIFSADDVAEVLRFAEGEHPREFEAVWARVVGFSEPAPRSYERLGFEPSFFPSGWFSPIADCMCFPRWHGTDREGVAFRQYFDQLNPYGLFASAELAGDFLAHYLSFDWTETGDYELIELWARRA